MHERCCADQRERESTSVQGCVCEVPHVPWRVDGNAQEAPCSLGRLHKGAMRKVCVGCANVQCGASTERLGEGAQVGVIYPRNLQAFLLASSLIFWGSQPESLQRDCGVLGNQLKVHMGCQAPRS